MEAGADEPGRLTTETIEERRARLVAPRETGSKAWRRFNLASLVVLVGCVGVFFGVVPGSSAVGRYPIWDLYALAERIEAAPPVETDCGPLHPAHAHVDLMTGRVVLDADHLDLSDEERSMVTLEHVDATPAPLVRVTRVAVGSLTMCVT